MRILFICNNDMVDYQCDCLFHGLNELPNTSIYTIGSHDYMYSDYPEEKKSKLYGMGFSLTGRIDPTKRNAMDINDVEECISNHFFDYVIYGQITRNMVLWEQVIANYKKNEIATIDGEDYDLNKFRNSVGGIRMNIPVYQFRNGVLKLFNFKGHYALDYWNHYLDRQELVSIKSVYFRRELRVEDSNKFYPINFAIPKNNIIDTYPTKYRIDAIIYPGKKETYIYKDEVSYYHGYQESIWGVTFKKGGWDCLRHYEILCNGCIPYFTDLHKMPESTMIPFPKHIIEFTNKLYESGIKDGPLVNYYGKLLLKYTRDYLTTEKLAEYVLEMMKDVER